jgi:predicted RNA binding protein YcfA (HicA-like mRNA interferase family)
MKRQDLIRHIERHGCVFVQEGGKHTIYINPAIQEMAAVPRHREIKEGTAAKICKELGIPKPGE